MFGRNKRRNDKKKRSWLLLILSFLGVKSLIKKNDLDK